MSFDCYQWQPNERLDSTYIAGFCRWLPGGCTYLPGLTRDDIDLNVAVRKAMPKIPVVNNCQTEALEVVKVSYATKTYIAFRNWFKGHSDRDLFGKDPRNDHSKFP
jgi:hypothetical protein